MKRFFRAGRAGLGICTVLPICGTLLIGAMAFAQLPTPGPTPTPEPTPTPGPLPTPSDSPFPTPGPTPTPGPIPTPGPLPTPVPDQPDGPDDVDCEVLLYSENFTSGLGGWAINNGFASGVGFADGLWRSSEDCESELTGHSSPTALGYAPESGICNYDQASMHAGLATSPVIDLADAVAPVELTFSYFLNVDDASSVTCEVNLFDNTNAPNVPVVIAALDPVGSQATLSNNTVTWTSLTIDISSFVGSQIQIQVLLQDSDEVDTLRLGWYVDDFQVCGAAAPATSPDDDPPAGFPRPTAVTHWHLYP